MDVSKRKEILSYAKLRDELSQEELNRRIGRVYDGRDLDNTDYTGEERGRQPEWAPEPEGSEERPPETRG